LLEDYVPQFQAFVQSLVETLARLGKVDQSRRGPA
jgi:hypothetical protein